MKSAGVSSKVLGRIAALSVLAGLLAGCGGAENFAGKVVSGGQEPIEVSPETFAPPTPCPPMQLQSNTFLIMKYARGKENDPQGLLYQATLKDWANTCTQEPDGGRRIKMGFSGDVTTGPAWRGGEITLPVRVAILPGGSDVRPLSSEVLKVSVPMNVGAPSESWTIVEDKFTIPPGQGVKVLFGFDEGRRR